MIGRVVLIRSSSGDTIPREEVVKHYSSKNLRKEDWSHRKLINHLQDLPAPDTGTLIGRVLLRHPSDDTVPREEVVIHSSDNLRKEDCSHRNLNNHVLKLPDLYTDRESDHQVVIR